MKNKAILLTISLVFMLALCGTVSATEDVNEGDSGGVDPDLPDVPEETDTGSEDDSAEDSQLVDPIIGVEVNYEYPDDSEIIPSITVTDSEGNLIDFEKTYNHAHAAYEISFVYPDVTEGTVFKIKVSAPGYQTQEKEVSVNTNPDNPDDPNFYGNVEFDLQATPNYRLGREVIRKANQLLNLTNADPENILCITSAGLTYLNNTTTEDCLEGILNGSNGKITYGQGNLLTLRKTRVDPTNFAFILRNGSNMTVAYYDQNGNLVYHGTISANMTSAQWNTFVSKFGQDDAFPYVSLANAWAVGLPSDTLRQAAYHGHLCLGTISGQAMIQTLLKYYPPGDLVGGVQEETSYRVLGVPGNSDDDAYMYTLDLTSGKRAYVGYATNGDDTLTGFIKWCATTNTGTLILMRFDEDAVLALYGKSRSEVYSSISNELAFNAWLVDRLVNNPESLVQIVGAYTGLTEEDYNYLAGGLDSRNPVADAHGLDMEYIQGKIDAGNLVPAVPAANPDPTIGTLTDEQMKQIGKDAVDKAREIFAALGITLEKDDSNLTVFTSAGYVRLNGQTTDMTWDGIFEELGSRLSRATLLPVHSAIYGDLWFQFTLEDQINKTVLSKTLIYDPETGEFTVQDGAKCNIADVVLYDPPYDALMGWLWHNHVCGGSSPGYLITDYIYENYPTSEDESYMFVGTSISCRDDIYQYLMGISPGLGTYFSQRMTRDSTGSSIGILIRWNEKLGIGEAIIIDWTNPVFAPGSNSYEEYIKLYKGDYSSPNLLSAPQIITFERLITREDLQKILSGGDASGNALAYVRGLPVRNLSDLIPANNGSQDGNQSGNTDGNQNGSSLVPGSQSGSGTGLPGSSVGDLGPSVNAASQVSTETGESGETGSSHEVSKVTPESEESGINTLWIAVGAILIGSLVALGFFKGTILGMLK